MEALAPFESQGERRRSQLIAVAARLVVTRGVDSVTHAATAEAAGCARTLVYRYFPTREDLLYAIPAEYVALLSQRITREEATASILAGAHARRGQVPALTRKLAERVWAPEDWNPQTLELRMALLVLVGDRDVTAGLADHEGQLAHVMESELGEPLQQLGLTPIEIAIVRDAMLAGYYHACAAALAGTITREEAMDLTCRVNLAALQMFVR